MTAVQRASAERFVEPPWQAALDPDSVIQAIPASATIAGMFWEPLALAMRQAGSTDPAAREHYQAFRFYPLRDFTRFLLRGAHVLFPRDPLRIALRKLGRAGPRALLGSTIGRVTLGSAQGPVEALRALAKTYSVNLRPSDVQILEEGERRMVLRLSSVHHFLDSHHVGVFEGVFKFAHVPGEVKIRSRSATEADFLCTWSE